MSSERRLRPWMLVSAAWIVPAAFAALDYYAQARLNGGRVSARELLFVSGDWLLYALLTPAVFAISRRWPLVRGHLRKRVPLHVVLSLAFCVAWATAGKILELLLRMALTPADLHSSMAAAGDRMWPMLVMGWVSWIFTTFPFGVAVYLCMVGIEHATRYFLEARDREVQLARVSEQLAGARLAALQARLNPHFLFNSLNTINVLVRDADVRAASRVIEQLSDVLRTTLGRSRENEVSLEDELDLVRQYLAVEQARFPDRLRPVVDVDPSLLSAAVPSFAVQHLVENALRHGIARRSEAGRVEVRAHRDGSTLEITVRDDGPGVTEDRATTPGHGLDNTRERLRTLYGERASLGLSALPEGGTMARLRVPYHEIVLEANRDVSG